MDILILIAIIAVGVSALYVAVTFHTRARQTLAPLVDRTERNIGQEIAATRRELMDKIQTATSEVQRKQLQAQADELRVGKEVLGRLEAAAAELRLHVQANTDTLLRNSELVRQFDEQAGVRQNRLNEDLAQLGDRIAGLSDAITQQSTHISRVYRYVIRNEIPAGNSGEDESLLLAMLEAESYVDDMGWGGRPHLFALAPSGEASDQSAAGNARPGPLALVDRGQLPEGELVQVLADTRWLADVVGCVLVTELVALRDGAGDGAPIDPDAAGQWASTNPDGRAARLAVGIRRSGAHKCGIRIKGEDEMRIRTDLAGDLVTALQRTF